MNANNVEIKLTHKEKRRKKLEKFYLDPSDIAYKGPLSYRYLRIIAWVAIALSQLLLLSNLSTFVIGKPIVKGFWVYVIEYIGNLSVPLFLIASFATILNHKKSSLSIVKSYMILYFAIGFGLVFFLARYLTSVLGIFVEEGVSVSTMMGSVLGSKVKINLFADLLALSAFYFFLTYNPEKHFQGKSIKYFRLMSLIPIAFAITSYLLQIFHAEGMIQIPIFIFPFLTTKAPLTYLLFICICFSFKGIEKRFKKLNGTNEQYHTYLKSNKISLSFSKKVSLLFLIFSVVDFILLVAVFAATEVFPNQSDRIMIMMDAAGIGQCTGLFLAIPVIFLFSYTKNYDDTKLDLLVPIIGIALVVLTYLEAARFILMNASAEETDLSVNMIVNNLPIIRNILMQ